MTPSSVSPRAAWAVGAAATLVGTTNVLSIIENIPAQNFTPTAAWNLNGQRLNNFSMTGWVSDGTTWTRTSNTTFTVPTNLTAIYQTGVVVKWQESGTQKYGTVLSSAFTSLTTVTLVPTSDYVMAANPDGGSNQYANSWLGTPYDFPSVFAWSGAAATGFSSAVTLTNMQFSIKPGRRITLSYGIFGVTSNATTMTLTGMPIGSSAGAGSTGGAVAAAQAIDAGVLVEAYANIVPSTTTVQLFRYGLSTAWTASGQKAASGQIEYGY